MNRLSCFEWWQNLPVYVIILRTNQNRDLNKWDQPIEMRMYANSPFSMNLASKPKNDEILMKLL